MRHYNIWLSWRWNEIDSRNNDVYTVCGIGIMDTCSLDYFNYVRVHQRIFKSVAIQVFQLETTEIAYLLLNRYYCSYNNTYIIIQNCFWHGTQHLGPLPLFLVSKYGEWAVVTFFRLPTTFGKHRRYDAHESMKVFQDLCFYLQPFILRHRPGLVHCKPPLLSNLNGCISQWWLIIWTTLKWVGTNVHMYIAQWSRCQLEVA